MKQRRFKFHQKDKANNQEYIYIELDTKCSCLQSKFYSDASIQFSRRYLQCQSSMPIAILRSFIQQILPHSSMTQVLFYDSNDNLLKDSDLISSLKKTTTTASSSSLHIPIRFTLFNKITSFGHCLCSSSSLEDKNESFSFNPKIIKRETMDKTLSTCSIISTSSISPCLSSSSSSSLLLSSFPNELSNSISIVNLLTPPTSSNSSFLIENIVHTNNIDNQTIIDEITSKFGEICPPLPKKGRNRLSKKLVSSSYSSNLPLDLSLKKRPSPFDFFSLQTKWIKT
ncbi:unnamed protein product [Rotaria sp. Silwood2]|nr:unnamed protein product [Rotaria sp. Silwood2]CAF3363252.1 unnamed protein product [Rotaria sp. Silwood2]CAF4450982.1 unnamed protein product [Rotaria sp. Silwood2]